MNRQNIYFFCKAVVLKSAVLRASQYEFNIHIKIFPCLDSSMNNKSRKEVFVKNLPVSCHFLVSSFDFTGAC